MEENFFVEFKEDNISTSKLMEEISAFANTNGGYIFLGISDDKKIKGCKIWNEQRITTTIVDSLTPTPIYDVKRFKINDSIIYIVKVYEGNETPYITNKGNIYERVGSSSCKIIKADRLNKLYEKSEKKQKEMLEYLKIEEPLMEIGNLYGYLDIRFFIEIKEYRSN